MDEAQVSNPALNPERWLDEHGDVLYRYALARLRDPDRAEDAVQETFAAALKAREGFSGRASERTWLVGILKHKIIDIYRKRYREKETLTLEGDLDTDPVVAEQFGRMGGWKQKPAAWANPHQALENKEFWATLKGCLDRLPGRLADAFVLREMEQIPSEEVRQILNITPTNLWAMLHRARLRLRQCLESRWFGPKTGG
jgi:RNA polymerase sigma-70 factor (ECF subfamily)